MERELYLKKLIKQAGYNLKDFAIYIDMPYTTLLSIVNKSVGGAALDNVIKICNGLNIHIDELNPYHSNNNITPAEQQLLKSYREHKEMQPAINKMLDINCNTDIEQDVISEITSNSKKFTVNTK